MTAPTTGDRLPYLLRALKAPRILERLASTAERARTEGSPYEQFLEALCEAEVFAREASGARQRIRHAGFPAPKDPRGLRLRRPARRRTPAHPAPRPSDLDSTRRPTSAFSARQEPARPASP